MSAEKMKNESIRTLHLVQEVCNLPPESFKIGEKSNDPVAYSSCMNPISGSGAIITNCKHYSHLECLRKYYLQQETAQDNQY